MDRLPKAIVIAGFLLVICLALTFNFILKDHTDHDVISEETFEVSKVAELIDDRVTIAHREQTEEKLKELRFGGRSKLQIIMDFDRTLTKYKDINGNKVRSTHDLFNSVDGVPESYKKGAASLYSMYGPLEIDPTIPVEDKIPFMEQWIYEYSNLIKGININNTHIEEAVRKYHLVFRDGAREMFQTLEEASVPILIFSAGLGDVIKAALHVNNMAMTNIHVISNFFNYEDNEIKGFKGKYVHAFNKNQRILEEIDFRYAKELSGRSNVILMGDSLGDSSMADGLPRTSTILRLGFLNTNVEENLQYYRESFDIVIAQDETMDVVMSILRRILYH